MADLGTIATTSTLSTPAVVIAQDTPAFKGQASISEAMGLPVWTKIGIDAIFTVRVDGSIYGQVTEGITPVAGRSVYCFNRATMGLVGVTVSDVNGDYTFANLSPDDKFVVFTLDPDNIYNGVIRDNVTPS
jgi:hypothetical protein